MKYQETATVYDNRKIALHHFVIKLHSPNIAKTIRPGQFVNILVDPSHEILLRRPFSVYKIDRGASFIEILYRVVGKGTKKLAQYKEGTTLDILGPLGQGFNLKPKTKNIILIGGGCGIAPLLPLAQAINPGAQPLFPGRYRLTTIIGAGTKDQVLSAQEFIAMGADVHISTDDGTLGHKGFATDILKRLLATGPRTLVTIYACGPYPMLKETARLAKKYKHKCQVSLEEYMGCGLGACLSCVCQGKKKNLLVCKDGPVFAAEGLIWPK